MAGTDPLEFLANLEDLDKRILPTKQMGHKTILQLVDLDNTITNTSHNANKNLWDNMT